MADLSHRPLLFILSITTVLAGMQGHFGETRQRMCDFDPGIQTIRNSGISLNMITGVCVHVAINASHIM